MNQSNDIDMALKGLNTALDHLEAALHRHGQGELARANLQEELAILQDDRSRLAIELDGSRARGKTLVLATEEVGQRLKRATSTIAAVLAHAGNT